MVFSSAVFLYVFLPVTLVLYYLSPGIKAKNIVLTALSLIFYAWGEPVWVLLLIISSAMSYTVGRLIGRFRGTNTAKLALVLSMVVNLGFLAVFKYSGFFVETVNGLLGASIPVPAFALPIGISFYTFQTMSYAIDVYRDKADVQRSFSDFLLFVSIFPPLIAGPIIRYTDVQKQLNVREHSFEAFASGVTRFCIGLGKKALIANHAGEIAARFLDVNSTSASTLGVWYGVIMFTLQIYFDFSGYSDMAIGLGKIFGFSFAENFNYPYISRSITEFWRRWHISLSSFFRDYVYIPLGGNRKKQLRNLAVVWLLTGLWHGASWNFILWGVYYGVLLIIEKYVLSKILDKLPSVVRVLYTIFIVVIGWCLFYFVDFKSLAKALGIMFGALPAGSPDAAVRSILSNSFFIAAAVFACTPAAKKLIEALLAKVAKKREGVSLFLKAGLAAVSNTAIIFFSTAMLISSSYNPFLYFRF